MGKNRNLTTPFMYEVLASFKAKRKSLGLTQETVCKFLGVQKFKLSSWENGHIRMTLEIALKLSVVYECSIDDIVKLKRE